MKRSTLGDCVVKNNIWLRKVEDEEREGGVEDDGDGRAGGSESVWFSIKK